MEQIFLKVKLPSGKTCLITNTGVNYARVWEEDLVTIGVTDPDIFSDTKRQLGSTTATPRSPEQLASLKQLKAYLVNQISQDPTSSDSVGFGHMVRALQELILGEQ
jgi:hypothetical protein